MIHGVDSREVDKVGAVSLKSVNLRTLRQRGKHLL